MSYFIFKEKPTLRKVLAMCVTIMGVTFTATGGVFDLGKLSLYGIFMGLICGFCFASLAITSRLGGQLEDTTAMTFYTMVFGLIALLIYGSIVGIGEFHVDGKLALISIINGSTSVALPYFMYGFAITRLKHVSYAPILSSVENVAATLFGTFIFGEDLGPWRVVGIVLVIISIAMINMPEHSKCTLKLPGCE
jgi:putative membrane protein